jgi:hypothetical protein
MTLKCNDRLNSYDSYSLALSQGRVPGQQSHLPDFAPGECTFPVHIPSITPKIRALLKMPGIVP